jgi:hypothetical protein
MPHAVDNCGTSTARIVIAMTPAAFEPMIRVRSNSHAMTHAGEAETTL